MTLRGYMHMQKNALKKSLNVPKPLRVMSLALGQYLSMLLLFTLFIIIFVAIFKKLLPLFSSLDEVKSLGLNSTTLDQVILQRHLLNAFIFKTVLLIVLTLIIFSALMALFNMLIMDVLKGGRWHVTKFIRLFYVYIALTLIFFGLIISSLLLLDNIVIMAYLVVILALLYSYALVIFQVSIGTRINFWRDVTYGMHNCIRLHKTLPPLIVGLPVLAALLLIVGVTALLLEEYSVILLVPVLLLWNIWMINYEYKELTIQT